MSRNEFERPRAQDSQANTEISRRESIQLCVSSIILIHRNCNPSLHLIDNNSSQLAEGHPILCIPLVSPLRDDWGFYARLRTMHAMVCLPGLSCSSYHISTFDLLRVPGLQSGWSSLIRRVRLDWKYSPVSSIVKGSLLLQYRREFGDQFEKKGSEGLLDQCRLDLSLQPDLCYLEEDLSNWIHIKEQCQNFSHLLINAVVS